MSEENIYTKIMKVRQEFKNSNIKKSGENKFQNFKYHELSDIVPTAIELCLKYRLYTHIDVGVSIILKNGEYARMKVINIDNLNEKVEYLIKMPSISEDGGFNAKIQDTGKGQTYIRRYLYMLFLDLAIPDEVDRIDNRPKSKTTKKTYRTPTKR